MGDEYPNKRSKYVHQRLVEPVRRQNARLLNTFQEAIIAGYQKQPEAMKAAFLEEKTRLLDSVLSRYADGLQTHFTQMVTQLRVDLAKDDAAVIVDQIAKIGKSNIAQVVNTTAVSTLATCSVANADLTETDPSTIDHNKEVGDATNASKANNSATVTNADLTETEPNNNSSTSDDEIVFESDNRLTSVYCASASDLAKEATDSDGVTNASTTATASVASADLPVGKENSEHIFVIPEGDNAIVADLNNAADDRENAVIDVYSSCIVNETKDDIENDGGRVVDGDHFEEAIGASADSTDENAATASVTNAHLTETGQIVPVPIGKSAKSKNRKRAIDEADDIVLVNNVFTEPKENSIRSDIDGLNVSGQTSPSIADKGQCEIRKIATPIRNCQVASSGRVSENQSVAINFDGQNPDSRDRTLAINAESQNSAANAAVPSAQDNLQSVDNVYQVPVVNVGKEFTAAKMMAAQVFAHNPVISGAEQESFNPVLDQLKSADAVDRNPAGDSNDNVPSAQMVDQTISAKANCHVLFAQIVEQNPAADEDGQVIQTQATGTFHPDQSVVATSLVPASYADVSPSTDAAVCQQMDSTKDTHASRNSPVNESMQQFAESHTNSDHDNTSRTSESPDSAIASANDEAQSTQDNDSESRFSGQNQNHANGKNEPETTSTTDFSAPSNAEYSASGCAVSNGLQNLASTNIQALPQSVALPPPTPTPVAPVYHEAASLAFNTEYLNNPLLLLSAAAEVQLRNPVPSEATHSYLVQQVLVNSQRHLYSEFAQATPNAGHNQVSAHHKNKPQSNFAQPNPTVSTGTNQTQAGQHVIMNPQSHLSSNLIQSNPNVGYQPNPFVISSSAPTSTVFQRPITAPGYLHRQVSETKWNATVGTNHTANESFPTGQNDEMPLNLTLNFSDSSMSTNPSEVLDLSTKSSR